jgi:hypothetical protein
LEGFQSGTEGIGNFHAHRGEYDRALLRAAGKRGKQKGVILQVCELFW